MEILDTMLKGFIIIALMALAQSFTVTDMKNLAIEAHKKGPMSYKKYTEQLTK